MAVHGLLLHLNIFQPFNYYSDSNSKPLCCMNLLYMHAVITFNEVLVVARGVNSLHVAWWTSDATVVTRYSVLCSALRDRTNLKVERSVEQFTDSAINSLSVDDLAPQTTYNCCVSEYGIDNSYSTVCKMATTLSIANDCQQGNGSTSLSPAIGAAISLFLMLLITLLCTSILFMIAVRQRQDGNRIEKW